MPNRNEYFRAVFQAALDAMFLLDDEGRFVDANPSACALTGCSRDEMRRMVVTDLIPGSPEQWRKRFFAAGPLSGELTLRRKDGSQVEVEYRATANIRPGLHLSIMRDISERRAKQETEALLAAVVRSSNHAVVTVDLNGIVMSWNSAAERIFGYNAEEMIGRSILSLAEEQHRPDIGKFIGIIASGGTLDNEEAWRIKKDGGRVLVSLSSSPIYAAPAKIIGMATIVRGIGAQRTAAEAAEQLLGDIEERVDQKLVAPRPYGLTFRELTVLHLVAAGKHDREIAQVLGISIRTAQNHLARILEKMGAPTRTDAGVRAVREHIVE